MLSGLLFDISTFINYPSNDCIAVHPFLASGWNLLPFFNPGFHSLCSLHPGLLHRPPHTGLDFELVILTYCE